MTTSETRIPEHVAVIMDGNGRWARKRALPRHVGHRSGVKSVREIVEVAANRGVKHLTLFAFSSENFNRPRDEVMLMALFLESLQREVEELHKNNVRLECVGARDRLNLALIEKINAGEELTANNDGLHLVLAVAYGGRWDIVESARLWNIAYSEMWFTDVLWPDFRERHFDAALEFFSKRQRRFGSTPEQLEAVKC